MKILKIKKLSQDVISKIAAGQVIERPASVVKELIENSLDAEATKISVELLSAGKRKIIVLDDGYGMQKDDLEKSFLPNTTSKISTQDDLVAINSFGFRGEALASMVAVAKVRIESRSTQDISGNFLELINSEQTDTGVFGMPIGTKIEVSNLFSSIPARKKFLKADTTEMTHIIKIITDNALANPEVAFKLINNKKVIFDLPKSSLDERLEDLLGGHVVESFIPIEIKSNYFKLTGFIGKPQISIPSKARQFLFVNKRSVKHKLISNIVKEVYKTLLEPRANPAFIFFLEMQPSLIDINITPNKTEVKFINEKEIIKALKFEINLILEKADLRYKNKGSISKFYEEYGMDFETSKLLRSSTHGWSVKDAELDKDSEILQVHDLYLVSQTKTGLLIIDQHAAHERILYEEFLESFNKFRNFADVDFIDKNDDNSDDDDENKSRVSTSSSRKNNNFKLPKTVELVLPIQEASYLETNLNIFEKLGFEIKVKTKMSSQNLVANDFSDAKSRSKNKTKIKSEVKNKGKNKVNYYKFLITKVPLIFKGRNIIALVTEVLHDIIKDGQPKNIDVATHRTIAFLACRTAIKAGDRLTPNERKRLLEKLFSVGTQYTCPHGRPVEVEIDMLALDKMFKRVK